MVYAFAVDLVCSWQQHPVAQPYARFRELQLAPPLSFLSQWFVWVLGRGVVVNHPRGQTLRCAAPLSPAVDLVSVLVEIEVHAPRGQPSAALRLCHRQWIL